MKLKSTPTLMVPAMTAEPPNQRTRKLPMAVNRLTAGQKADMTWPAWTLACMLETLTCWNSRRVSPSLLKLCISFMPLTLSSIFAETLAMVLLVSL